jgi:hypothetical protein
MQSILASIFNNILGNEEEDIDLKDRAAFYYRALQTNPEEVAALLRNIKAEIIAFVEDEEDSKVISRIECVFSN